MKKLFIVIFILGFLGATSILLFSSHKGFDITIRNQTDTQISKLYLTYHNISSDIKISSIPPNNEYKLNVNPTEEFGENSMKLYYHDNEGNLYTECIFGYFEKGYYGDAIITLKSVDEKGKIKIEVEANVLN